MSKSELDRLREDIDKTDQDLVELLAKRFNLTKEVGIYKKSSGDTIHQGNRWEEVLKKLELLAQQNQLPFELLESIWDTIHEYSKLQQEVIADRAQT